MPFPTIGKRLGELIKQRLKTVKGHVSGDGPAEEDQADAISQATTQVAVALIPSPAIDLNDARFSVAPFMSTLDQEADKRVIYDETVGIYLRRKHLLEVYMREHPNVFENNSQVATLAKRFTTLQKKLEQSQQDIYQFEMAIIEQSVGIHREGDPSVQEQLAACEAGWRVISDNFTELDNRTYPTRVVNEAGVSELFHGDPEMTREEFKATYGSRQTHTALAHVVAVSCAFGNMYCAGWEWLCAMFQQVILWQRVQVHELALTFCHYGPK